MRAVGSWWLAVCSALLALAAPAAELGSLYPTNQVAVPADVGNAVAVVQSALLSSNASTRAIALIAITNLQAAVDAEAQARASGDVVAMTNWQAIVYSLTNGAALGETALQPAATNGWTVGSHAGLATWGGATNAASAVVSSFAATGSVAHATDAGRIAVAGDADCWQTVEHGTATVWRVEEIGVVTTLVVTAIIDNSPESRPPPGLGQVFIYYYTDTELGTEYYTNSWGSVLLTYADDYAIALPEEGQAWTDTSISGTMGFGSFDEIASEFYVAFAYRSILSTNSYPLALHEELAAHNTDGSAHPDIREAIDAIPLPPTNTVAGWLVWDTGSNCYWQVTATNLRFYVWGVAE